MALFNTLTKKHIAALDRIEEIHAGKMKLVEKLNEVIESELDEDGSMQEMLELQIEGIDCDLEMLGITATEFYNEKALTKPVPFGVGVNRFRLIKIDKKDEKSSSILQSLTAGPSKTDQEYFIESIKCGSYIQDERDSIDNRERKTEMIVKLPLKKGLKKAVKKKTKEFVKSKYDGIKKSLTDREISKTQFSESDDPYTLTKDIVIDNITELNVGSIFKEVYEKFTVYDSRLYHGSIYKGVIENDHTHGILQMPSFLDYEKTKNDYINLKLDSGKFIFIDSIINHAPDCMCQGCNHVATATVLK